MKNNLLYILKSKIIIKVSGKNTFNFIKKLKNNNIDLLNIKYKKDYILITIYKDDYDNLLKLKTIYDIDIVEYKGLIKIKKSIINNYILLLFCIISITLIYILSNIIFSIDVITNDSKMKLLLISELKKYNIKKYSFKKNYKYKEFVKSKIINKYRDTIEWIEIENIGTKYIIKYEPRIKSNIENNNEARNIIAKKDAVITKIMVRDGEIIKSVNTYVKKGEVIVQGKIFLNESLKEIISATGTIYGEVWYKVSIKYPLKYYENIETGKKNNILSIVFLNKRYNINSKYKTSNIKDNIIMKNNIFPIYISLSKEYEVNIIDESNNSKEAIDKAISKSIDKINSNLSSDEYIENYKVLSKNIYKDYVELDIFFTVIENITEYEKIVE